jgi:DNA-binding protein HU-beta
VELRPHGIGPAGTDGGQVNRSQLLNALAERNGISRKEADALMTSFVDVVTETVCRGEDVTISGFAKFRRVETKARMGRNPQTGAPVKIPARKKVRVTPLKVFKEAVLSGKPPKKAAKKAAPAKRTTAKKAPAKKAPAKKAPARKPAAKKTTKRR